MSGLAHLVVAAGLASILCVSTPVSALDAPHDVNECTDCHFAHAASYPALLGKLCESCHFEGGPARAVQTHSSRTADNGYGNWDLDCWACHDPHTQQQDRAYGTTYGMLLRVQMQAEVKEIDPLDPGPYYEAISTIRTVTSSNIEHTSSTDFVDGDGQSSDDICQVCHLSTAYYNPSSALNLHADYGIDSQPGGDCTQCHLHGGGFSPAGGGSCTGCHASPQGSTGYRRQVAGAGGDFERPSHHVTDGSTTEIVTDEDCQVCHNQSLHQANAEPTVYLNDPDQGAALAHVYDGTGASLKDFCLNCHDSDSSLAYDSDQDGSDGSQPFTDGRNPPDIATRWASASHNLAALGALTDGACMACHGGSDSTRSGAGAYQNAHGSSLGHLLSALINGTAVANTEESLCHACHDGLAAATDVQGEFAKGTNGTDVFHHPVDDSEQSGGRSVECASCHDTHAATSADPLAGVTGIDLDGNAVGPGTGNERDVAEYEVCLVCHGDDYNTTRSRTTNKRTDFAVTNSSYHPVAQPGRNTSSALAEQLIGGLTTGSTLTCADCHNNEQTSDVPGLASSSPSGPQGPHGSTNPYILRAYYWTDNWGRGSYVSSDYGLCFLCHDETKLILADRRNNGARTNFDDGENLHRKHVFKESKKQIGCPNCHWNTHSNQNVATTSWVINTGGGVTEYTSPPSGFKTRGVSFSPEVMASGYSRPAYYINTSTRQRRCYLRCHGKNHGGGGEYSFVPPSAGDDDSLLIP